MRTISHKIILLITLLIKTFGNLINFLTQNPLLNLTFLFLYSFLSLLSLLKTTSLWALSSFAFTLSLSLLPKSNKETKNKEREIPKNPSQISLSFENPKFWIFKNEPEITDLRICFSRNCDSCWLYWVQWEFQFHSFSMSPETSCY